MYIAENGIFTGVRSAATIGLFIPKDEAELVEQSEGNLMN